MYFPAEFAAYSYWLKAPGIINPLLFVEGGTKIRFLISYLETFLKP